MREIRPIKWVNGVLELLDQTRLPSEEVTVEVHDYREAVAAIRNLTVRGAPAIGVTAAYAVAMAARQVEATDHRDFLAQLSSAAAEVSAARPTAVNLQWAVNRMMEIAAAETELSRVPQRLLEEAQRVQREDEQTNRRMGEHGKGLMPEGGSVLTHCNAGALATSGFGTALGVIRAGWEDGKRFKVYNTETRPVLQGARLTAWEFQQLGIPSTLVVDSAAGMLMERGQISCVITGADRIAANGDTAKQNRHLYTGGLGPGAPYTFLRGGPDQHGRLESSHRERYTNRRAFPRRGHPDSGCSHRSRRGGRDQSRFRCYPPPLPQRDYYRSRGS